MLGSTTTSGLENLSTLSPQLGRGDACVAPTEGKFASEFSTPESSWELVNSIGTGEALPVEEDVATISPIPRTTPENPTCFNESLKGFILIPQAIS
jgi:hypothetical protein